MPCVDRNYVLGPTVCMAVSAPMKYCASCHASMNYTLQQQTMVVRSPAHLAARSVPWPGVTWRLLTRSVLLPTRRPVLGEVKSGRLDVNDFSNCCEMTVLEVRK